MSFMGMYIYRKGALCSADCDKCSRSLYAHEWIDDNYNERRDAMQAGTLPCDDCNGHADPVTFVQLKGKFYAGRYSADGYLDCSDWVYETDRRRLERTLRANYGDSE